MIEDSVGRRSVLRNAGMAAGGVALSGVVLASPASAGESRGEGRCQAVGASTSTTTMVTNRSPSSASPPVRSAWSTTSAPPVRRSPAPGVWRPRLVPGYGADRPSRRRSGRTRACHRAEAVRRRAARPAQRLVHLHGDGPGGQRGGHGLRHLRRRARRRLNLSRATLRTPTNWAGRSKFQTPSRSRAAQGARRGQAQSPQRSAAGEDRRDSC